MVRARSKSRKSYLIGKGRKRNTDIDWMKFASMSMESDACCGEALQRVVFFFACYYEARYSVPYRRSRYAILERPRISVRSRANFRVHRFPPAMESECVVQLAISNELRILESSYEGRTGRIAREGAMEALAKRRSWTTNTLP